MKKIILMAAILITVSCKKNYYCDCTLHADGFYMTQDKVLSKDMGSRTKGDATNMCNDFGATLEPMFTPSCSLH